MVSKKCHPRRHGRIRGLHLAAISGVHHRLGHTGHPCHSLATGTLQDRGQARERRHRGPKDHIGEQYESGFSAHLHGSHASSLKHRRQEGR